MEMIKNNSKNNESDERTYADKEGDEIFSSYRLSLLAYNSSGFDSWVVLKRLDQEIKDLKFIGIARGLTWLSFRCGVKKVNSVELPQCVNFTCTQSHVCGSLEKIGR